MTARSASSLHQEVHELVLVQGLIEAVRESVRDAKVLKVELAVGKLTCVSAEALRFSFDVATRGTLLEGASLVIREIRGRGRCRACECEQWLEQPVLACASCGSVELEVLEGEELRLREVEIV